MRNVKWFAVLSVIAVIVAAVLLLVHDTQAAQVVALMSVAFSILSLHQRD